MPRLCLLLVSLVIASSASAVTMDWTPVGSPGNACDPQFQGCFGTVGYTYSIGTYEVTNAQYTEFLNAKAAAADPLALYSASMGSGAGGITRTGAPGSYSYSAISGRGDMPVNFVSFYDALRFANWMNNGQGNADTETGAYTLLGGTVTPSNGTTVTRNAGAAEIFVPSEAEWYKAAYYAPAAVSYYDYSAGSNATMACTAPSAAPNSANCDAGGFSDDASDLDADAPTGIGSYPGSASPIGTFDQGGNVTEWNEAIIQLVFGDMYRGARGGSFFNDVNLVAASARGIASPGPGDGTIGFRLVMMPEPGTGLLVVVGLLGLAGWRRGALS